MSRKLGGFGMLALLALGAAGVAQAILGGTTDGAAHPQVGLVAFYGGSGGAYSNRCTGTLLSPTVVLTAAHCVPEGSTRAHVWFDPQVGDGLDAPVSGVEGTAVVHPQFTSLDALGDTHDLAVIRLARPVSAPVSTLAPVGAIDQLAARRGNGAAFTIVGYGVEESGPAGSLSSRSRMRGETRLVSVRGSSLDGWNVKISSSGGWGNESAGQCYGDSGGPVFVGNSTAIAAIASFDVSPFCAGVAYSYRIDTPSVRAWLAGFLSK